MLFINDRIQIAETEFEFSFSRSGGPGGQNVNKVNSRATLAWNVLATAAVPDDVMIRFRTRYAKRITREGLFQISSQKYRDQGRNVSDCLSKLRELILDVADPPVKRKATKPSAGAKQRRLSEKRVVSERKQNRRRPASNE